METVKKRDKLHTVLIAVVLLVAFGGLFLMGDYGIAGDSQTYLLMGINREPLYPLFLWGLRRLFGEETFYVQLAFLQNLFAYLSVLCLMSYIGRRLFHSSWGKWLAALLLTMPYLLTPLFSRSHLVMTNKIMAEGITLPGYYFFVLYLLKIIYEERNFFKNMVCAAVISALLVLARGQLMLTIIVLAIVICIRLIRDKEYRRLYFPFIIGVILFIGTGFLTKLYHYGSSGVFVATASSKPMILANVLYVSEYEDGADIEDPDLALLFQQTYAALDRDQKLSKYAGDGIIDKALHHEDCHDTISFDYFEPTKNGIYENRTDNAYSSYLILQDQVAADLTEELLANNWDRYLVNYLHVCVLGFIRSIAVVHPILNIYVIFAYLTGLVLLFYTWKKKGFTKEVFFFGMTYIMIIGFVTATSLFLQCITRYMIYNFPFFYIAGASLLFSLLPQKQDGEERNKNGIQRFEI